MIPLTSAEWDRFLQDHPEAHLLQTSAWGDFKAEFGWQVERVRAGETGRAGLVPPFAAWLYVCVCAKRPGWTGLARAVARIGPGMPAQARDIAEG